MFYFPNVWIVFNFSLSFFSFNFVSIFVPVVNLDFDWIHSINPPKLFGAPLFGVETRNRFIRTQTNGVCFYDDIKPMRCCRWCSASLHLRWVFKASVSVLKPSGECLETFDLAGALMQDSESLWSRGVRKNTSLPPTAADECFIFDLLGFCLIA